MNYLNDLLQSASNTAASNVSGPVDGIAWLLRKIGVPVPDAPVGSSEWMAQRGLTKQVPQSSASLAGETLGLLAPVAAAAKAPQIAQGLIRMGENAAAPRTLGTQRGVFRYPQEEALATAQMNATEMLGLPPNNTPMDRAKALGFDTEAVHFSRHGVDVPELDSGKFAIAPFDAVGTHVGSPQAALERYNNTVGYKVGNPNYALDELKGVSYPVSIKSKNPMLTPEGKVYGETPLSLEWSAHADYGHLRDSNAKLREQIFGKYDSVPYINDVEGAGSISHIVPPKNIRSRFAAFDPARIADKDLLASMAAFGLLSPLMFGNQSD